MTIGRTSITLIGEEIAGPWNAGALADIAGVFGGTYLAYDGAGDCADEDVELPLLGKYDCLMAAENLPDARSVYTFRPPTAGDHALMVGNEAKGLRRRTLRQAHAVVEIPLASGNINCLNVAAAAAVMLYYLSLEQPLTAKHRSLPGLRRSRPDVLLLGGCDPMELGSTVRSACAFGWERVFLNDAGDAWYECDRRIKSEGRGAARRGRNPIKVIPHRKEHLDGYGNLVVFTTQPCGPTSRAIPLTGSDLLIVLPDETAYSAPWSPPSEWNGQITYIALPEVRSNAYHYRQMSAIALAEVARQVGTPAGDRVYLKSKKDRYKRAMAGIGIGMTADLEDLAIF